ncbi:hypothetical protein B2G69_25040 [Methylorubrum zatmanii]|nr:hypothetical protein B2G69_25040 [Methylorubrum zatmanii]
MIWAWKRIVSGDLRSIELLFQDQVAAFDDYKQMMLIKVDEDWPMVVVFVAVLDEALFSSYYDFKFCTRRELPSAPTLVAGCRVHFCRVFGKA